MCLRPGTLPFSISSPQTEAGDHLVSESTERCPLRKDGDFHRPFFLALPRVRPGHVLALYEGPNMRFSTIELKPGLPPNVLGPK